MFSHLLGLFDSALALQITLKIGLALLLGGLVGLERERHNMPAGVRTFMLVSVGACMFTILSFRFGGDPARVAAQIVTGIGFLGAGVVMQRGKTVHGLTSAAGIWSVAAVGMAVGMGDYFLAALGAVSIFVVLGLLRQVFKVSLVISTRQSLNTALRRIRAEIAQMGGLVEQAIHRAVEAAVQDDHLLAQSVIAGDTQIDYLRRRIEESCLDILRTHHPDKLPLRTVLAANHIATELERMGDYGHDIARIRLRMGHEPLPEAAAQTPAIADQVCDMLRRVLEAFGRDDIKTARRVCAEMSLVNQSFDSLVSALRDEMSALPANHFEQTNSLYNMAYFLKRVGERVTNIAERIAFVRTGAIQDLDRDE